MKMRIAICLFTLLTASPLAAADEMKMPMGGTPADQAFAASMQTMMKNMHVKPTGDTDKDFVLMMMPHHQGAIDMAQAVLRNGRNEQIRRLAQEIIVTQQQEIAAMRLAIGDPLPPSVPSPTQVSGSSPRSSTVPFLASFRKAGEPQ